MFCGCATNPWDSISSFLTEPPNDFKDIGDYIDDASFWKKSDEVIEVETNFDDVITTKAEEGSLYKLFNPEFMRDWPIIGKIVYWGGPGH